MKDNNDTFEKKDFMEKMVILLLAGGIFVAYGLYIIQHITLK